MKKLLLLSLTLSIGLAANSQSRIAKGVHITPVTPSAVRTAKATIAPDQLPASSVLMREAAPKSTAMRTTSTVSEAIIGSTIYDTQTNRSMGNRITNNLD